MVYSGENERLTKILLSILVNQGCRRARQATAPRRNIAPKRHLCDNVATVLRHCRIGVALGIYEQVPLSQFLKLRTKEKPRLRKLSQARLCSLTGKTGPVPIFPPIFPRLSMLLWDLPPANSTSPCAAAWGCSGRTARSALGAPSNIAGSHSDSR